MTPLVSVIVANWNGAAYLEAAVVSALRQSHAALEVIVADDASTDVSATVVARLIERDARVRWLRGTTRGGPAAARNRALDAATGEWIAVLDSDDVWHPDRLRRLLAVAQRDGADLIADDLLLFDDDPAAVPRRFLRGAETRHAFAVTPGLYLRRTRLFGRTPDLGYLKPIIRTAALRRAGARYDERLHNGEDDDLVTQLLAAGARYRVVPSPTYFYRRHPGSISHRLTLDKLAAMKAAAAVLPARFAGHDAATLRAVAERQRALAAATRFQRIVVAIKARRVGAALAMVIRHPRAALLLRMPLAAAAKRGWRRWRPARPTLRDTGRNVLIVSRQRIVGRTNGSSAYLLDLAASLRAAGYLPHLLQPSPGVVGRRPVLRLRSELTVFQSHQVRGVWKLGATIVSRDPRVWRAATAAVAARAGRRLGIVLPLADTAFPHAIAAPWTDADRLFVAAHGRRLADAIIADYVFQAEAIPYLLRPDAPSAILMHDLYAQRQQAFAGIGAADSIALPPARERALLGRADAVIAIQRAEAAWVARHVPEPAVIVAPIAASPVAAPQPGEDGEALFVGSDTPPNVLALRWFFAEIWPLVRRAAPAARLRVAGSVAAAFVGHRVTGVTFLGVVADLAPLYARAGVVVSPLTVGSGLKVKLIEALAQGKASVVTGVTLQGVEDEPGAAVRRADTAEAFAAALVALLSDGDARLELGGRAVAAARAHFAAPACHRPLLAWLESTR